MLTLGNKKIFFVDTHCQWYAEDDCELFAAALSYAGYDAGIMAVPQTTPLLEEILRSCRSPFLVCRGSEQMFSFAHIIAMGYEGPPPDCGTPMEKLRFLKSRSDLLLFAHPAGFELQTSGLFHDCFREKLLDGFEYFNGWNFRTGDSFSRDLFSRYGYTPVAGCDTHNPRRRNRPHTVYSPDFPPCGSSPEENDIDTFGGVRTLVFADACSPAAIADAIRNGRTLVEGGGKLYGSPGLVRMLESEGYEDAVRRQDAARKRLVLSAAEPLLPGRTITLRLADALRGSAVCGNREFPVDGDSFQLDIPPGMNRPHLAVTVFEEGSGLSLTSSLQLTQPMELNLEGTAGADGVSRVEVSLASHDTKAHNGILTCGQETHPVHLGPGERRTIPIPVHPRDPAGAEEFSALFSDGELICSARRKLTFLRSGMSFELGRPEQVHKGLWQGPGDCSARLTLSAEKEGLRLRARVVDPVHVQKKHGRFLFFGDSLQIGLTFDRVCRKEFSFYNFQTGLTDSGPELHFTGAPSEYRGPFPVNALLPGRFCEITPFPGGLEYNVMLPFDALNPYVPEMDGKRLRLFLRLFNCNGPQEEYFQGVKTVLEYPVRSSCWMIGEGWTVFSFEGEAEDCLRPEAKKS